MNICNQLMWRTDSFEKTPLLEKIEGRRRRGPQRMRWLDGITDSMDMSLNSGSWWWTGRPGVLQFTGSQRVGHDWATELNGKNSEPQWSKRLHAQSLSCVSLFVTLWTVAHQALLSMEFSRQEYWSGLPFSPPRGLPNPGIKSTSPSSVLASRFFNTEPTWEAPNQKVISVQKNYICLISSSILQENKTKFNKTLFNYSFIWNWTNKKFIEICFCFCYSSCIISSVLPLSLQSVKYLLSGSLHKMFYNFCFRGKR